MTNAVKQVFTGTVIFSSATGIKLDTNPDEYLNLTTVPGPAAKLLMPGKGQRVAVTAKQAASGKWYIEAMEAAPAAATAAPEPGAEQPRPWGHQTSAYDERDDRKQRLIVRQSVLKVAADMLMHNTPAGLEAKGAKAEQLELLALRLEAWVFRPSPAEQKEEGKS